MASHNLDRQPEEVLITEIAELKRQLSELRTLQLQGAISLNYSRSDAKQASVSVPANSGGYMVFTIENSEGKSLLTTLESSFYQDSVDAAHEIGSNLNNYRDLWKLDVQFVENLSSNSQIRYRLYYFNTQAAAHTLYWRVRGRWVVAGGTTS